MYRMILESAGRHLLGEIGTRKQAKKKPPSPPRENTTPYSTLPKICIKPLINVLLIILYLSQPPLSVKESFPKR